MGIWTLCLFSTFLLGYVEGQQCSPPGQYIGATIRPYNFTFNITQESEINSSLSEGEDTGTSCNGTRCEYMEVILNHTEYSMDSFNCTCGMVTMWQFYAWRYGTVIFYVLKPSGENWEVVNSTKFVISKQSRFNFFEIPLSSALWIPIQKGYRLGFYANGTSNGTDYGEPIITYQNTTFPSAEGNTYYKLYSTERNYSTTLYKNQYSEFDNVNKTYAVAAFVIPDHKPMFVNAPFTTTVYQHQNSSSTPIYTARVIDLDTNGNKTLQITKIYGQAEFEFDNTTYSLYYKYELPANYTPYIVTLQLTDDCPDNIVTEDITIYIINEPPKLNALPAHAFVDEDSKSETTLHVFIPSDPPFNKTDEPLLNCTIDTISSIFTLKENAPNTGNYSIVQKSSTESPFDFSKTTYFDLNISCTNGLNDTYSNFQVYVVQNKPPYFNSSTLNYTVPDRTADALVYEFSYGDSDSTDVNVTCSCSSSCPLKCVKSTSKTDTYEIRTTANLSEPGYDFDVQLTDGRRTTERTFSISTSGRPFTFNSDPSFVNLPHTMYVMENTPIGTTLFKVMYTDENPSDNFTLAQVIRGKKAETYFEFEPSTGLIKVKSDINYEQLNTSGSTGGSPDWTIVITLRDGIQVQHTATVTGTITFHIVNENEGISIAIQNKALIANETTVAGTAFPDPIITADDIDGDTPYFSMNCGNDSKYFYLDSSNLVRFAREYDIDAGLPGTATCNVSVRDAKGLYDSDVITLTVTNINDNSPKFPYNTYVFFVSTTTPFFTEIANMSATDADVGIFGTAGLLKYRFEPLDPTEEYFQIDAAGILYVRNLTAFTSSSYIFEIIATDSGGKNGTCTVTVVFSGVATTTTTTTERSLAFTDDYQNYFWLLLIGLVVVVTVVIIVLMVWFDPVVHEFMSFKLLKLSEWCRKKPKPKQPRRVVGKLTVTVNNKQLENDPDNALPWELLARDADVPEINEVQQRIERRKERADREYKNFAGLPVFEKGKGRRPDSSRTTDSTSSTLGRPESDSPKYATFRPPPDDISDIEDLKED